MRNENTMSKKEYAFVTVFYGIIAAYWFKQTLFICLDSLSFRASLRVLLAQMAGFGLFGTVLDWEHNRNNKSLYRNLLGGIGIYLALSYYSLKRKIVLAVLGGAAVIFAGFLLLVFGHGSEDVNKAEDIRRARYYMALRGFKNIAGMMGTVLLAALFTVSFWGAGLVCPSVKPADRSSVERQTISNNMDMLLSLEEETWEGLPLEERLDVMQTIANIEQRYLGIPHEINVAADNLKEGTAAHYDESQHMVVLDIGYLMDCPAYDSVNNVTHEVRHCYQFCLVHAYANADEDLRSLRVFRDAEVFLKEFSDYNGGTEDYEGYYDQFCERDAREYAEEAAEDYMDRVYAYIYENGMEAGPACEEEDFW